MLRLFVALDLPEEVGDSLLALQAAIPGIRWTPYDNLHLTLRFIGEVDEPVAGELDEALAQVVAPGFTLRLSGVGHWGTQRRASQLWAGVERSAPLQFLHDKVDRAAVAAGLPPGGRKYRPHVTVGRRTDAPLDTVARWEVEHNLYQSVPFAVTRFLLYRSRLQSDGPTYEVLADYPLAPAES